MGEDSYTLLVVPDHNGTVRRYRLRGGVLRKAWLPLAVLTIAAFAATAHWVTISGIPAQNEALREENRAMTGELAQMRERLEYVGSTLDRVERFDTALRGRTQLLNKARNVALGPLPNEPTNFEAAGARTSLSDEPAQALTREAEKLTLEARQREASLQELQAYFEGQKALLAATPSVWPLHGSVTSDFGAREDPFTAEDSVHLGLDVAGPLGKQVVAPASGTVLFAGREGGYGNVLVIDHGFGLTTRYGHLSIIRAKLGEKVQRGQAIGAVGTTGRSTGPHLHYEVRLNGVAQNPRKFMLDD